MKILKYINVIAVGSLLLAACNGNDYPKFNDKDAFVAFDKTEVDVKEEAGNLKVPVTLTSLAGLSSTVAYTVKDGKAKEGTNYELIGTGTLSFTKENPTQYIEFDIQNIDGYTGDLDYTIELMNSGSVNMGVAKECKVSIIDKDHPLSFILNTYAASAPSYFSNKGPFSWDITISKDADDVSKVWVSNIEPYFASNGYVAPKANYFYGIVNEEKTEIRIPSGQAIGYKYSDGSDVTLVGFDGADPDESAQLTDGDNIIIQISAGGSKLTIKSAFGAYIPVEGSWYNLMYGDLVITKK